MTTSTFVANLAWVLLALNWIVEWNWKEKFADFKDNRLLHICLLFFFLHCVGLLYSDNLAYGLDDIRKKLPLLVIPLVILTSKSLSRKEVGCVAGCYVATVFVVSVIGLVRYLSIPDLPYREIVPYISHIRFALNVCFVIGLLCWIHNSRFTVPRSQSPDHNPQITDHRSQITAHRSQSPVHSSQITAHGSQIYVFPLLIVWFMGFLLLLRSYTAFVVLLVMPLLFLCRNKNWRSWKGVLYLGIVVSLVVLVGSYRHDYYGDCERGNFVIENGSYIEADVSESSLRAHWGDVSEMPVDALTPNGYPVYPTLVRYLNSCGYPKEASGIAMLSDTDVKNIEQGIANSVYANKMSLRSMCYVLFYELECYRVAGSLGESSFLHRVALWKNGWKVFLEHPMFGVGTGDVVDVCHAQLYADGSQLAGTGKHVHNQYLSLLLAFGIVGCALLLALMVRLLCRHAYEKPFLFILSLAIVLISCLSEDTFETLAGCLFACIPCLFYRKKSEL